tara:strand:- start:740 stop:1180 length:441 start_codon:yes stop_codon:yes gene_type:complete
MTEQVLKDQVEKKKGPLGKLKDALIPDQEESAAIISTFVRITVLAWSGAILTLNYVAIPGIPQQKIDPTFIASVFTGVLSSLGIQTASKKGDGTYKADEEKRRQDAQFGNVQTIRVETPIKLVPQEPKIDKISGKEIDPQSGRLIP